MSADLWNFATACYSRADVEAACLRLQDAGADVCLLLCAAWLERRGEACTPTRLRQLLGVAADWQREVVAPLRRLRLAWRRAAPGDPALQALRQQLLALELAAEREELARLERLVAGWPSPAGSGPAGSGPAGSRGARWLEELPGTEDGASLALLRAAACRL